MMMVENGYHSMIKGIQMRRLIACTSKQSDIPVVLVLSFVSFGVMVIRVTGRFESSVDMEGGQ